MTRACVLLARAPSAPGKTRLTSTLPDDAAIALRRALLLDTFEAVCAAGEPVIVAFTPSNARAEIESLIADSARKGTVPVSAVSTIPQRENGDLGDRMYAALQEALRIGASQVTLVGSDMPTVPAAHVQDAFARLDAGADVVFGPAEDGGYYLVGVAAGALAAAAPLFNGMRWGSDDVLRQTLASAAAAGLGTALAPEWFDVDTPADLARVADDARVEAARHTRAWINASRPPDA